MSETATTLRIPRWRASAVSRTLTLGAGGHTRGGERTPARRRSHEDLTALTTPRRNFLEVLIWELLTRRPYHRHLLPVRPAVYLQAHLAQARPLPERLEACPPALLVQRVLQELSLVAAVPECVLPQRW